MTQTTYLTGVPKDLSAWPWRELTKDRAKELEKQFDAMVWNGGVRPMRLPFTGDCRERLPQ